MTRGWLPKDENFNKPIINKVKSLNLKAKSKGLIVKKKKKQPLTLVPS